MKDHFFEQLITHLDKLDAPSIKTYLRKISQRKGFMETISNAIREGIIVIDLKRTVHYFNPAAAELVGLPENCRGEQIDRFMKSVNWNEIIGESPETWLTVSRRELEVFYPQHRYLNFYVVPHSVTDEVSDGFAIVILSDITDQVKSNAENLESRKSEAISMLAASVAHEIGNPLNGINIHLQLLERMFKRSEDFSVKSEAMEAVTIAREELSRLDTIINNFLKAIRPARLDISSVNIVELLEQSLRFIRLEVENKNILIEADWRENIPKIFGDADQLKQAFYNIIKNAINAMPEGGVLRIVCKVESDKLMVCFEDSGVGISEQDITRILDPYYTTRQDGNGLGLMVVERIIRDHGGSLNIISKVDEGTLFQVVLPLKEKTKKSLPLPEDMEV